MVVQSERNRGLMLTAAGERFCGASTSSTPSGCSSRPRAGPGRNCATRNQPTVDLAGDRHLHPTTAGPAAGDRPASPLGETTPTPAVESGSHPAGVSQHPRQDRVCDACTKTQPTRPGRPPGSRDKQRAAVRPVRKNTPTGTAHTTNNQPQGSGGTGESHPCAH
jgi:hypothetical protein